MARFGCLANLQYVLCDYNRLCLMICKKFVIIPTKFNMLHSHPDEPVTIMFANCKIKIYVTKNKIIYCFNEGSASLNIICTDHVLAHVSQEFCFSKDDYFFRYIDLSEISRITGFTNLIKIKQIKQINGQNRSYYSFKCS